MKKACVLVVEDEFIIAEDICSRLESLGYTVCGVASSGQAAIQQVQSRKPDLVLMDIVLRNQQMDGIDAALQISSRFDIPFIYVTAYSDEKILERAKTTEPMGYIVKPFTNRELQIAIEMALYKSEMGKKLRQSERKARDELEQRVKERTGELVAANEALHKEIRERKHIERELKLSMKKLEQSNKELQDFTWIAAHDLQEPLRKIQAFGDRLRHRCGTSLNEMGQDHLERMINAANRMQNLVRALLDYSRLTDRPVTFKPLDLGDILRQVIVDLRNRIEEAGGTVEIGELPEIEADATQMRQLFQNLICNALKYRREIPPVIRIYGSLLSNGFCRIYMEDNGIGFEEQYLDRIFRPFQRLHDQRSQYEGTGMGLAICRKVVDYHGGTITAKSTQGKGSTFIVTLPVKQPVG